MTKIRIELELDDEEFTFLLSQAVTKGGFLRVEPRKRWSEPEYKEAIRFYIKRLVQKELTKTTI